MDNGIRQFGTLIFHNYVIIYILANNCWTLSRCAVFVEPSLHLLLYCRLESGLRFPRVNNLNGLRSFTHLIQIQSGFHPHPEVDYLNWIGIQIRAFTYTWVSLILIRTQVEGLCVNGS